MENNRSYFMRRAAQERSAATHARDRKVRAVHEDLAQRYHELAHAHGIAVGSTATAE
jgi:hypothetical protein